MPSRVVAVVGGGIALLDRRDAAAVSMARRFAGDTGGVLEVVMLGGPVPLPGAWSRAWSIPASDARAAVPAVAGLVADGEQVLFVAGETPLGTELAARLAFRLGCPVIASAQALKCHGGLVQVTRPAVAGTRSVSISALVYPVVVVASADAGQPDAGAASAPTAAELAVSVLEPPELLGETRLSPWEMDVTEADVVVAGGRGVGGRDGFELLGRLAAKLGGAIGATRVAVDLGWAPRDRQVGLTGRTVSPRLYIACGISGAIHHTLGMRGSGFIVAINTDPRCPIFGIANASVVGDVRTVVPGLIEEIDRRVILPEARVLVGSAR